MVHESNDRLYGPEGIAACREALRDGGCLAVWSAHHDDRYLQRLQRGGFEAEARVVPARGAAGGLKHVIFLAVKRDSERPGADPARRQRGSRAPPLGPGSGGSRPPRRRAR
jgi:spermidine synthase